ncbi:MAG: M6 family metalloprotease domain-containing protein [bacterium]
MPPRTSRFLVTYTRAGALLTLALVLCCLYFPAIPASGASAHQEQSAANTTNYMPAHPDLLARLGHKAVAQRHAASAPAHLHESLRQDQLKSGSLKITGTGSCLLILFDWTDHPADQIGHPNSAYDDMIFSTGTLPTGSMNDFYLENSFGQFSIVGDVIGWNTGSNTYFSYAGPDSVQGFGTCREMLIDAIAQLDPFVDYAQYDSDGPDGIPDSGDDDGFVDALFFVHAGPGEEQSGDPKDIWSHASGFWPYQNTNDGVQIFRYSVEPEETVDEDLATVGVYCHEYGHVLGLPDLYDTDYSTMGIGEWGAMSGGSWGHRPGDLAGSCPTHFTAWCKKELGWVTPVTITSNTYGMQIPPAETSPIAYQVYPGGLSSGDEYFLCENRRNIGFDEALVRRQILLGLTMPEGLIIYHVDEAAPHNSNESRRLVDVVEASPWFNGPNDWYETLEGPRNYSLYHNLSQFNRGDNGDLWPGFTAFNSDSTEWLAPRDRNRFADDTIPPAEDNYCQSTGIAIENITLNGTFVEADFVVGAKKERPVELAKATLVWDFEADPDSWEFCRSIVHHDTYHGNGCPGSGGLWFGLDDPEYACPPGYGNGWNDVTWQQIGVGNMPGVTVTITHKYELEEWYDYGYLEVRCARVPGTDWHVLGSFTGEQSCITENFDIPTSVLNECYDPDLGFSVIDLRLRMTSDGAYSAEDGNYCGIGWWIDQISVDLVITDVDDPLPIPRLAAKLLPASPNPVNPSTLVRFHVPTDARQVSLGVYDQRGRLVRSLVNGLSESGWLEEVWDGRDDSGERMASGLYFARLEVDGLVQIQKMAMVK